jgi:hypothetical protein
LHPRTGTAPNPGWFAPTDGSHAESLSSRTAQNDNQSSGASPTAGDDRVMLRPANRIDELGDFAEWLANANPEDEQAIRAEIKRYFEDIGWAAAAHDLNSKLSVVLRLGVTREARQKILDSIDLYTRVDPAEYVGTRDFLDNLVMTASGLVTIANTPSLAWKLGWARRGAYFEIKLGGNLPAGFKTIDRFASGVATSIKSIDLDAATYLDAARLTSRLNKYVDDLSNFNGGFRAGRVVESGDITDRVLSLAIPKGSVTAAQRAAIEAIRSRAKSLNIYLVITEF